MIKHAFLHDMISSNYQVSLANSQNSTYKESIMHVKVNDQNFSIFGAEIFGLFFFNESLAIYM